MALVKKTLVWLCRSCKGAVGVRPNELNPLLTAISSVFSDRGKAGGIKFVKTVRGNFYNFLSGNCERIPGVALRPSGLPSCFGPLAVKLEQGKVPTFGLQLILTVLTCTRGLTTPPLADLESIESPSKRGTGSLYFGFAAVAFWKKLGYRHTKVLPRALRWRRFHFTTKTGPNGPALATWLLDLNAIPEKILHSIKVLGGSEKLNSFIREAKSNYAVFEPFIPLKCRERPEFIIRRLQAFSDKEGKTRVVAILDYFSQTVLRGLHRYLFRVLAKIPQDCTFDQSSFKEKIKGWDYYCSADLSAATDRFPIQLISEVLRGHLPDDYVAAWETVMIDAPFLYKHREVHYSVGNPMGAYSSWASFALAHHYLFYFICLSHNWEWDKAKYVVLGDDVLIGDRHLADAYLNFIRRLGVEVSLTKTHHSTHFCEFAKRLIYRGEEVSPFPISALKGCSKRYYLMTSLLLDMVDRELPLNKDKISEIVADFYKVVMNRPSRFARRMEQNSFITERVMQITRNLKPASDALNDIIRKFKIPIPMFDSENPARKILALEAIESFRESDPYGKPAAGPPLGDFAVEILMRLTSDPLPSELFENPWLHAYGNIEADYLAMRQILASLDSNEISIMDWDLKLRSMTVPLSDRSVFIDERRRSGSIGQSVLAQRVLKSLRKIVDNQGST